MTEEEYHQWELEQQEQEEEDKLEKEYQAMRARQDAKGDRTREFRGDE